MAMNLDSCTVYIFVRQDIPIQHQVIQSGHAALRIAQFYLAKDDTGTPNLIVIGVPDIKALERVMGKLARNCIKHMMWVEPDGDLGFTALATAPLTKEERLPLANYRLWRYSPGASAQAEACRVTPDRGANADVAQLREHLEFNQGAEGENPSIGSKI